jgi:N-acetylglutamate synthase/N-acetylornithine aminotransferase
MWKLTDDMRGLDNVAVSGVQDITGASVANCGTGEEGARDAALIVKCVNAHDELVAVLRDVSALLPSAAMLHPEDLFKLQTRVVSALAKVQS